MGLFLLILRASSIAMIKSLIVQGAKRPLLFVGAFIYLHITFKGIILPCIDPVSRQGDLSPAPLPLVTTPVQHYGFFWTTVLITPDHWSC